VSSDFPTDPTARLGQTWVARPPVHEYPPPGTAPFQWREWLLPSFLLLATILSTTYAGLFYVAGDVGLIRMLILVASHPSLLLQGVSFSFTIVMILLAHEMGHFLACRHYGIRCTPPYFLPLPISIAGTMGAFIRIRSPFQSKRALFDVGIAGPLAGFVFVVPALIVGIAYSTLIPKGSIAGEIAFGEPLLFRWIGAAVLGYSSGTQDMIAHPIAMAAWFGLLATSLNLFPIWQLDGGHIAYAMLGRELQKKVSIGATVALVLVSFAGWPIPSYLLFAVLIMIVGLRARFYHPPTLYDDEAVGTGRRVIGVAAMLILIICFTPVPIYLA